jgi:hypothetical protein
MIFLRDAAYIIRFGEANDRDAIRALLKKQKDEIKASQAVREQADREQDQITWIVTESVRTGKLVACGAIGDGKKVPSLDIVNYGYPLTDPTLPSSNQRDYSEGRNAFVLPEYRRELKGMGGVLMILGSFFGAIGHGSRFIIAVTKERSLTNGVKKLDCDIAGTNPHPVWTLVWNESARMMKEPKWSEKWRNVDKVCARMNARIDRKLNDALRGPNKREDALKRLQHAKL